MDGASLKPLISAEPREYTFAQTSRLAPAMWLYYWLASIGVNPFRTSDHRGARRQMVANICASAIWTATVWANRGTPRAVADHIGFTVATTQDIWAGHPEKVLGATR